MQNNVENKTFWPSRIILDITNKCNLSCIHCSQDSGPYDNSVNLGREKAERFLSLWVENGLEHIALVGGEPLMNVECDDIIKYCTHEGTEVEIVTNGLLLTESRFCELYEMGIWGLTFSLYGLSSEIHEKITKQHGSFERTIKAMSKALTTDLKIVCNFGLTNLSATELLDNWNDNILRKVGLKMLRIQMMYPAGRAKAAYDKFYTAQDLWLKLHEKLYQSTPILGRVDMPQIFSKPDSTQNVEPCRKMVGHSISISRNGEIYACCMANGHPDFLLGHCNEIRSTSGHILEKRLDDVRIRNNKRKSCPWFDISEKYKENLHCIMYRQSFSSK